MLCAGSDCVQIANCSANPAILVTGIGFFVAVFLLCIACTCLAYYCRRHDHKNKQSPPAEIKAAPTVDANSHGLGAYLDLEFSKPSSIPMTAKDTPYEAQYADLLKRESFNMEVVPVDDTNLENSRKASAVAAPTVSAVTAPAQTPWISAPQFIGYTDAMETSPARLTSSSKKPPAALLRVRKKGDDLDAPSAMAHEDESKKEEAREGGLSSSSSSSSDDDDEEEAGYHGATMATRASC